MPDAGNNRFHSEVLSLTLGLLVFGLSFHVMGAGDTNSDITVKLREVSVFEPG